MAHKLCSTQGFRPSAEPNRNKLLFGEGQATHSGSRVQNGSLRLMERKPASTYKSVWFAAPVVLVGLLLTIFASYYAARSNRMRSHSEFDAAVQHARATIQQRLESYVALLRGTAGFLSASSNISRAEFRTYVDRLGLASNYPGVQGIGWSIRIAPEEREALARRMEAQGAQDFRVWPDSERPEYYSILYLEPQDARNQAALGYDMFSEPVRREAMERARDTGHYTATHRVTLVQEIEGPKQFGFLIYVPVYRGGAVPETLDERRRQLLGFVYSPFRIGDLISSTLAGVLPPRLRVEVYDRTPRENGLLFSYPTTLGPVSGGLVQEAPLPLDEGGREWLLRFESSTGILGGSWLPLLLFILGAAASLALAYSIAAEGRARREAEAAAAGLRSSEQAFRNSENYLRLMLETAQDYAIVSLDVEGRIVRWNTGAERLFGFDESEAIGRPGAMIFTPEDRAAGVDAHELRQAREIGHASDERWHQRKDGSRLYVSGVVRPMRDISGSLVGYIKVARDITDRLVSEEHLRREKEFSETILNSLPGVFYLVNSSGHFLRWNRNLEMLAGCSAADLRGRSLLDFFDPADRSRAREAIEHDFANPTASLEASFVTSDGRRLPCLFTGRRIEIDGSPCVAGMGMDISERVRAEQDLREAEERLRRYTGELERRVAERTEHLQDSLDSLEGVLYHVAHDLRAPLRAMSSFTSILWSEYGACLDQRGRDYARRITDSAGYMDQLVQDLLDYGRLAHAPVPLGRVSLETQVQSVIREHSARIEKRHADVSVESPLPDVSANPSVLHQIFSHLLDNALKFVDEQTTPRVRIRAEQGPMVRIWIEDNGIGIKADYHERIFRVFERLHGSHHFPGTGIGLAIVQKGLQRMNGTAGVESSPGAGSRFWLELPRATGSQAAGGAQRPPKKQV